MDPKLSDNMPAQQDSSMASRFSDNMPSDAPAYAGEGGSPDATPVEIMRDSTPQDAEWMNVEEKGSDWETEDKKAGSEWELTDRKEDSNG